MPPTTTRARTVLAVTLLAGAALLSSCTGDANGDTTTTSSTTTTTTSSTTTSSSSSTSTPPTDEEQAEAAVVAFYKELDLVAAGKARLDSFRHAASDGGVDTTTTLTKWQTTLANQLMDGVRQVGDTKVYGFGPVESTKPQKIGSKAWPAWSVTACVDRSGIHLEDKAGKTVPDPGTQKTSRTTYLIVKTDHYRVLRDDPGKSC